jgi:ADP-ribose pyrophosphatase YjhB (NUDIX family)
MVRGGERSHGNADPGCAAAGPAGCAPPDLDGPVDGAVAPQPVAEVDRPAWFTLMAPGWRPPAGSVTQVYGLCFDSGGRAVLVCLDDGFWTLPGGQVEPGETLLDTLVREVREEACARVVRARYLACQHVWDPQAPAGPTSQYQARFWARVEPDLWRPRYETVARSFVAPALVPSRLSWADKQIVTRLLELAIGAEQLDRRAPAR